MRYMMICYDIQEDKIRTRLYKYLLKIDSIPLQKSVHLMSHNYKNKEQRLNWIRTEILPKLGINDQIHIFPFTEECIKGMLAIQTTIDLSFLLEIEEIVIL